MVTVVNETVAPVCAFRVLLVSVVEPEAVKEVLAPEHVSVALLIVNAALMLDEAVSVSEPLEIVSGSLQDTLVTETAVVILIVGFPETTPMVALSFTPGAFPPTQLLPLAQLTPSPAPDQTILAARALEPRITIAIINASAVQYLAAFMLRNLFMEVGLVA